MSVLSTKKAQKSERKSNNFKKLIETTCWKKDVNNRCFFLDLLFFVVSDCASCWF